MPFPFALGPSMFPSFLLTIALSCLDVRLVISCSCWESCCSFSLPSVWSLTAADSRKIFSMNQLLLPKKAKRHGSQKHHKSCRPTLHHLNLFKVVYCVVYSVCILVAEYCICQVWRSYIVVLRCLHFPWIFGVSVKRPSIPGMSLVEFCMKEKNLWRPMPTTLKKVEGLEASGFATCDNFNFNLM